MSALGTAFFGSAFDTVNGTGFANGRKHVNVRALFPMYGFHGRGTAIERPADIKSLDGRRVGCGLGRRGLFPRLSPTSRGSKPAVISGTPADQGKQLLAGEIDAFWQGAVIPFPSLVAVSNSADCVVFCLSDPETASMRARFPFMAEVRAAAGLYKGQASEIKSVAAWNVVVAHEDLPEEMACRLTKAALTAPDLMRQAGSAASSTKASNAGVNTILDYHPGALRALRELGAKLTWIRSTPTAQPMRTSRRAGCYF